MKSIFFSGSGVYKVRTARDGSPLPQARSIRTMLFPNKNVRDTNFTIFFYAFGQFVSHDMGLASPISDSGGMYLYLLFMKTVWSLGNQKNGVDNQTTL